MTLEETFSKVLRNRDKDVDSVDSADSMGKRLFGQSEMAMAVEKIEKKFDTMMDMMSRMIATFRQSAGGGHNQDPNQNMSGNNGSTSNNSGGNGNGSNNGNHGNGMPVGSVTRPLQLVFPPRETPPPEVEVPVAELIRASFVEYATFPQEIRNAMSLDQYMNQKKRRERSYDNCYSTPRDFQQALGKVTLAHFDGSSVSTTRA